MRRYHNKVFIILLKLVSSRLGIALYYLHCNMHILNRIWYYFWIYISTLFPKNTPETCTLLIFCLAPFLRKTIRNYTLLLRQKDIFTVRNYDFAVEALETTMCVLQNHNSSPLLAYNRVDFCFVFNKDAATYISNFFRSRNANRCSLCGIWKLKGSKYHILKSPNFYLSHLSLFEKLFLALLLAQAIFFGQFRTALWAPSTCVARYFLNSIFSWCCWNQNRDHEDKILGKNHI